MTDSWGQNSQKITLLWAHFRIENHLVLRVMAKTTLTFVWPSPCHYYMISFDSHKLHGSRDFYCCVPPCSSRERILHSRTDLQFSFFPWQTSLHPSAITKHQHSPLHQLCQLCGTQWFCLHFPHKLLVHIVVKSFSWCIVIVLLPCLLPCLLRLL